MAGSSAPIDMTISINSSGSDLMDTGVCWTGGWSIGVIRAREEVVESFDGMDEDTGPVPGDIVSVCSRWDDVKCASITRRRNRYHEFQNWSGFDSRTLESWDARYGHECGAATLVLVLKLVFNVVSLNSFTQKVGQIPSHDQRTEFQISNPSLCT